MGQIQPNNPDLLTDDAIDHTKILCCGNENFVFLKCPKCAYIWIECFECSTWYTDLSHLTTKQSSYLGSDEQRVQCPSCSQPFQDFFYLENGTCDEYLPTLDDIQVAGHTDFLTAELKARIIEKEPPPKSENKSKSKKRIVIPVGANRGTILGAGIGSASWIILLAIMLLSKGFAAGAMISLLCATAVLVVGFLIVSRATRGRLISLFHAAVLLLGASFFFGLSTLLILQSRDELEPILDENNHLHEIFNFGPALILLVLIGIVLLPPVRDYLKRFYV